MKKIVFFIFILSTSVQAQIVGGDFFFGGSAIPCGANLSPGYFRQFMCHNLGANTSLNPNVPAQGLYGDYYQWGRITPAVIEAWNSTAAANSSWIDVIKGLQDPCPTGFRVPTRAQWEGVIASNPLSRIGSWQNDGNFSSALQFGTSNTQLLILPAAGLRKSLDGSFQNQGSQSYYWTSSQQGTPNGSVFSSNLTTLPNVSGLAASTEGASVRCIADSKCMLRMSQNPDVFKEFMCHNLGADPNYDPNLPSAQVFGNYYKWGQKLPAYNSNGEVLNPTSPIVIGSWLDLYKTDNDPCPAGFRVPTNAQWEAVLANNLVTKTEPWPTTSNTSGFRSMTYYGTATNPKLLALPAAGNRSGIFAYFRNNASVYWSSSEAGGNPFFLNVGTLNGSFFKYTLSSTIASTFSAPIRCIVDDQPRCMVRMSQAPDVYKEWMCHNLGAETTLDPNVPAAGLHGNYYQWGSKTVVATNDPAAVAGWNSTVVNTNAWLDAVKKTNDPCPERFVTPSKAQWDAVIANNMVFKTGSWAVNANGNFTSALQFSPDGATNSLSLPAAGYRLPENGLLSGRGSLGYYWSSTEDSGGQSYYAEMNGNAAASNLYAATKPSVRAIGASVRCIEDEKCGAYVASGVYKEFMCHNLGADQTLDPDVPQKGTNGDYYDWGSKTPLASIGGPTGLIWNVSREGTGADWSDASKGIKDPCPTGFKIPTREDWAGVVNNNAYSKVGTWAAATSLGSPTNFSAGSYFRPSPSSKGLTLPTAGNTGTQGVNYRSKIARYWSSTPSPDGMAHVSLTIDNGLGMMLINLRNIGSSVRCIAE